MNSFELIRELVSLVEEFEQHSTQKNQLSIESFTGYLNSKTAKKIPTPDIDIRFGKQDLETQQNAYQIDNNIARLFIYMSRYAKSYIKKALSNTHLTSAEDFTSLAVLFTHQSLSKTELIQFNLLEKTSGTEIINRLLNNDLITQWDDPTDKRSKRIAITEKGKELLYVVFEDMNHVAKMITGKLSLTDKITLQYLLQQLEAFHFELHSSKSINTKNDMILWENNS